MWTYIVVYNRFIPHWFVRLFQVRFWTLIPAFPQLSVVLLWFVIFTRSDDERMPTCIWCTFLNRCIASLTFFFGCTEGIFLSLIYNILWRVAGSPLIIIITPSFNATLHQAPDGSGCVRGGALKQPGLAACDEAHLTWMKPHHRRC